MRLERLEQKSRLPVLKKNPQNYAMLLKLGEFNATFISIRFEEVFNRPTKLSPSQEIMSTSHQWTPNKESIFRINVFPKPGKVRLHARAGIGNFTKADCD